MEQFIHDWPQIIITLLSTMVGIIAILLSYLLWRFQQSVEDLKNSVTAGILELKLERVADRLDIGHLLDRMQRQETLCESQRRLCPGMDRRRDDK